MLHCVQDDITESFVSHFVTAPSKREPLLPPSLREVDSTKSKTVGVFTIHHSLFIQAKSAVCLTLPSLPLAKPPSLSGTARILFLSVNYNPERSDPHFFTTPSYFLHQKRHPKKVSFFVPFLLYHFRKHFLRNYRNSKVVCLF